MSSGFSNSIRLRTAPSVSAAQLMVSLLSVKYQGHTALVYPCGLYLMLSRPLVKPSPGHPCRSARRPRQKQELPYLHRLHHRLFFPRFQIFLGVPGNDFPKLPPARLRDQVHKQPTPVNIVSLCPAGEFALNLHHLHRAICILNHVVACIMRRWKLQPAEFLWRQQVKAHLRRCTANTPGLYSRQYHPYIKFIFSSAAKSLAQLSRRFCSFSKALLRRGLFIFSPRNLRLRLRPVPGRQVFQIQPHFSPLSFRRAASAFSQPGAAFPRR